LPSLLRGLSVLVVRDFLVENFSSQKPRTREGILYIICNYMRKYSNSRTHIQMCNIIVIYQRPLIVEAVTGKKGDNLHVT
jgi:hypothetical protein